MGMIPETTCTEEHCAEHYIYIIAKIILKLSLWGG